MTALRSESSSLHDYTDSCDHRSMSATRVPMTMAARMGISKLAARSAEQPIVLTSHGRPVAVLGSAERLEADARIMREASAAVLDAAADLVSARGDLLSLDETCERLGIRADVVRARLAELRR